jgi:hypothetical protein
MSETTKLRVSGHEYVLDSRASAGTAVVDEIRQAMAQGTVVAVPVLDEADKPATLVLHGGRVDAVLVGAGPTEADPLGPDRTGPKPSEMSPP